MIETGLPILVILIIAVGSGSLLLTRSVGRKVPGLTVAAILLLVLSALGVSIPGTSTETSVQVRDVSWSMGGEPVEFDAAGDRRIVFGRRPVVLRAGVAPDAEARAAAGEDGSDLAAALRLAAESVDPGGVVTVATDGRVASTGLAAAAARVHVAGATIRVVGAGRPEFGDFRVDSLRVPGHVGEAAGVTVLASVAGPAGSTVLVYLFLDGEPSESREVQLGVSGRAGLRFDTTTLSAGSHEVGVGVAPSMADPCFVNNRRNSGVIVAGARRAALLNASGLAPALRAGGWEVLEGLPENPGDCDLVVVRDVRITAFEDRGDSLRRYVQGGGGLLVAGGPRCFGPGGWGGAPLETCLPVLSHPSEEGLFVAVLLDRSGTMSEPFRRDGPAKFDVARRATEALTDALPAGASLLVIPFAADVVGAPEVVAIEGAASRAEVRATLDGAGRPTGGTSLVRPLERVAAVLDGIEAEKRLVLLFTDGRLEGEKPGDVTAAAAALRNEGVRVVCFAVGEDADRALLDRLGGAGRDSVPVTEDGQVREGFLGALFELQGEDRVLEGKRAVSATGEPGLEAGEIGTVDRMVRTWLRPGSTAWHVTGTETGDDAPVTAGWRYGLGRAVVVTADLAKLPGPVTAALVEAAARPAALGSARIEIRRSAGGATAVVAAPVEAAALTGWMTDAAGKRHPVSFAATGPGRFEGVVPSTVPGACWFDLAGPAGAPVRAGASVPWPPEYAASGPDEAALAGLSRLLGGNAAAVAGGTRDVSWLVALVALLLFLADRARSGLKRGGRPVR